MCRMIGKVSFEEKTLEYEVLEAPRSLLWLSENGRQPDNPDKRGPHKDGNGISYVENGIVKCEKYGKENFFNDSFKELVRTKKSKISIAHIRRASEGLEKGQKCSHPFYAEKNKEGFALCHNGAIYGKFMEEAKLQNSSDSEIFLNEIVKRIKSTRDDEIFGVVNDISKNYDFSSLTSLFMTKDKLCAWRIYKESEKYSKYYTLYISFREDSVILASEPIDDGEWSLLPNKNFISITPLENSVKTSVYVVK